MLLSDLIVLFPFSFTNQNSHVNLFFILLYCSFNSYFLHCEECCQTSKSAFTVWFWHPFLEDASSLSAWKDKKVGAANKAEKKKEISLSCRFFTMVYRSILAIVLWTEVFETTVNKPWEKNEATSVSRKIRRLQEKDDNKTKSRDLPNTTLVIQLLPKVVGVVSSLH